MICTLGGWSQNYLNTPEAFWASTLHCFRYALQFSHEIYSMTILPCCGDVCGPYFWHLQCLRNCRLLLAVFTVLSLAEVGRYGFEISR